MPHRSLSALIAGSVVLALVAHAEAAPRWKLIHYRQIGNLVNGDRRTIENHVFHQNGSKAVGVGMTNAYNANTAIFGYTDVDGHNRINPLDLANCSYDMRVYNPPVATDQTPSFYFQNPPASKVYSFVTQWLYVSDDTKVAAYPTTPVYHYDLVTGINQVSGMGGNCVASTFTEPPGANSDAHSLSNGASYQAQTFVVPLDINRIVSAQVWLTRGWEDPPFYYRASIHQGGPTGVQIGPAVTSPLHHSVNFREEAVCWGVDDVPVTPGQTYAIKLVATDGRWMNVWATNSDNYAGGCLYNGATQVPGRDMIATIVGIRLSSDVPHIGLDKTELVRTVAYGSTLSPDTFTVRNDSGGGTLNYTITDNASWLQVTPGSGNSTGEADTITVTYSLAGLTWGTYNATITVADPNATNSPKTIAVTVTITPPPPHILRAPAGFSHVCPQGTNQPQDTFTVQNTGGSPLNYTITDDVTWLAVTPQSGTSTGETDTLTVYYFTSSLAPGAYNATITITDPNADNSPQTIGVALVLEAHAGADLDFDADVDLMDFSLFQLCFAGPNNPPALNCTTDADLDNDADVDLNDFGLFQACFNGPNRPPRCL